MKIKTQIFLLFLIITITLTGLFTVAIYYFTRNLVHDQIKSHLTSISETKTAQLRSMIGNIHEMSSFLSKNSEIIKKVEQIEKSNRIADKKDLSIHLSKYVIDILKFQKIDIVDSSGRIIASSDGRRIDKIIGRSAAFQKAKSKGNQIIGIFPASENIPSIRASDLIKDRNNKIVGAVVIDLEADEIIDLVNDYTGLGRTGETDIAAIQDGKGIYIAPLKFDRNAALTRSVSLDDPSLAMGLALTGKTGLFENVVDYTGAKVIAYIKYIEETDWGIVTKIDQEEAYSEVYALQRILLIISLLFIVIVFLASYFLGSYIAKPIEQLIDVTNKVKEGNFQVKIDKVNSKELSSLAESFNEMTEKLEHKIEALDKFAYIVSHDLKSPLNSIAPLIDLIKKDKENVLSEKTLTMMAMAYDKTKQMSELIDQILLSTKNGDVKKEIININSIIDDVLQTLSPPSNIKIFIQKSLPPIRYHKMSILQVFQNLLSNAIKYMDKETGEVKVEFVKRSSCYEFSVRDNGIGIKDDKLEQVFKIFHRENKERSDSTGIGLSIVKRIVEYNQGKIWVESQPQKGSTFYFTVPIT